MATFYTCMLFECFTKVGLLRYKMRLGFFRSNLRKWMPNTTPPKGISRDLRDPFVILSVPLRGCSSKAPSKNQFSSSGIAHFNSFRNVHQMISAMSLSLFQRRCDQNKNVLSIKHLFIEQTYLKQN